MDDQKVRDQLRTRTAELYRRAYPAALPQDAFNWRLRVTGKGGVANWTFADFRRAIRYLEDKIRNQTRTTRKLGGQVTT